MAAFIPEAEDFWVFCRGLYKSGGKIAGFESPVSPEIMYWMGYIYRYWHYYKNMSSSKIYDQADFKTMKRNYMIFHTMDPELVIDDLIEIKNQHRRRKTEKQLQTEKI